MASLEPRRKAAPTERRRPDPDLLVESLARLDESALQAMLQAAAPLSEVRRMVADELVRRVRPRETRPETPARPHRYL